MKRGGAERGLVVVVIMSLVVTACAFGSANSSPSRPSSHPSAPFTVAAVPADFEFAAAERGRPFSPWGSDTFGTAEPFTVLARHGRGGSDSKLIVVSVTGFSGYESGLDQAAPSRTRFDRATRFRVNGRRAIYTPPQVTTDGRRFVWSDLVGSVDAGVVAGLHLDSPEGELTNEAYRIGPGNPMVHRMRWSTNDRGGMTVTTYPARDGSLDAIPGYVVFSIEDENITSRPVRVAGRRGVTLEIRQALDWNETALFTRTRWGNLVMVTAWGTTTPSVTELVAMAATVQPTSEAEWSHEVPAPTSTPADR